MALERRTIVNQIEVNEFGTVQVRFAIQIVDGDNVIHSRWHRTAVDLTGDVDQQLAAVNAHMDEMGEARVSDKDIDRIKRFHDLSVELNGE